VPLFLEVAMVNPEVSSGSQPVIMFNQVIEWWPLAIVVGLATTFIVRSVVEGSAG